jgi:hypothetical protein
MKEVVRWWMNFSSDAIEKIEGLLGVNRDFFKPQMAEKAFARWLPNESKFPIRLPQKKLEE